MISAWTRCSQVLGIFFEEFEKACTQENDGLTKSEEKVQILDVLPREREDQLSKRVLQGTITAWGSLCEVPEQEEIAS